MTYPLQDKEIIDLMNSKRHIKFKNYTPNFKDSLKRIISLIENHS